MKRKAGSQNGEKRRKHTREANEDRPRGILFKKSHGQHILRNMSVIRAIIAKAGIQPTDVILEIGPGTGCLTEQLLQTACKKVVCIEVDERMIGELKKKIPKVCHAETIGDYSWQHPERRVTIL
mmetsp:Transcript_25216/g.39345  ORF Transcript_25216/g.39345 Transcript_25216/m.39345 type:complete len:124 (-) Transcript_25216:581-952(-)